MKPQQLGRGWDGGTHYVRSFSTDLCNKVTLVVATDPWTVARLPATPLDVKFSTTEQTIAVGLDGLFV